MNTLPAQVGPSSGKLCAGPAVKVMPLDAVSP